MKILIKFNEYNSNGISTNQVLSDIKKASEQITIYLMKRWVSINSPILIINRTTGLNTLVEIVPNTNYFDLYINKVSLNKIIVLDKQIIYITGNNRINELYVDHRHIDNKIHDMPKISKNVEIRFNVHDDIGILGDQIDLGIVRSNVEIRIDTKKRGHAKDREIRHGFEKDDKIDESDIIDDITKALDYIVIAAMWQKKDIVNPMGTDIQLPENLKRRFLIFNEKTLLNIVCSLVGGNNSFTLTVITVMIEKNFYQNGEYKNQLKIEV